MQGLCTNVWGKAWGGGEGGVVGWGGGDEKAALQQAWKSDESLLEHKPWPTPNLMLDTKC